MGAKVGLALVLHWAFGVVFGVVLHVMLEFIIKHLKQRIMKIDVKSVGKKIWCGALSENMVELPPHDSPLKSDQAMPISRFEGWGVRFPSSPPFATAFEN